MSPTTAHENGHSTALMADSPDVVASFVERIAARATSYRGDERRREPRTPVTMAVPTQPLNDLRQRCGEPFTAITKNISTRGIAIYYTKAIAVRSLLAMQLRDGRGETLSVVMRVAHCERRGPLFEIGGEFVGFVNS